MFFSLFGGQGARLWARPYHVESASMDSIAAEKLIRPYVRETPLTESRALGDGREIARSPQAREPPGNRLVQAARGRQQAPFACRPSRSSRGIVVASTGNHAIATSTIGRKLADPRRHLCLRAAASAEAQQDRVPGCARAHGPWRRLARGNHGASRGRRVGPPVRLALQRCRRRGRAGHRRGGDPAAARQPRHRETRRHLRRRRRRRADRRHRHAPQGRFAGHRDRRLLAGELAGAPRVHARRGVPR